MHLFYSTSLMDELRGLSWSELLKPETLNSGVSRP